LDGTAINVDTGHCIPIFGQNTTFGSNEVGDDVLGVGPGSGFNGVIATAQFANATVKTDNTSKEGHTISTADAEGLTVSLCNPTAGDGDCDGDDGPLGLIPLLTAVELQVTAEAECELSSHGHVHASARATTQELFNDLFVLEGFHAGSPAGPFLAHLTPSGAVNESFPIINIVTVSGTFPFGLPLTEQITINEQRSFSDGGVAWIKATALHLIMTNAQGTVILNLSIDVVFAAIHCEKHLPNDDAIGA
jgi:hypothetical protein